MCPAVECAVMFSASEIEKVSLSREQKDGVFLEPGREGGSFCRAHQAILAPFATGLYKSTPRCLALCRWESPVSISKEQPRSLQGLLWTRFREAAAARNI